MKIGVVVFPGSNCDHDAWYAFSHNLGQQTDISLAVKTCINASSAKLVRFRASIILTSARYTISACRMAPRIS
jgi:phosphoribosylformylglycinamidine (FGAM) synthase-like amidotransferase family enzyme